jgi:CheY-like chemotaxis protein
VPYKIATRLKDTRMSLKILIVDDEEQIRYMVADALNNFGYSSEQAESVARAMEMLQSDPYDVIITDKNMPDAEGNPEGGLTLLRDVKAVRPYTEVIMMTGYATIETAVEAMKLGAFDYLIKPFSINDLKEKIDRIAEYKSFLSSEFNLRMYKNIHNALLAALENRDDLPDEKLKELLKSLGARIDHLFGAQKEYETIIQLQQEALEHIEAHAQELKTLLSPENPAYKIAEQILAESLRRI